MGGQVERSGDERRTGHKRPGKVGMEKVMGNGQKVNTEREREENDSEKEHVGEEGRI